MTESATAPTPPASPAAPGPPRKAQWSPRARLLRTHAIVAAVGITLAWVIVGFWLLPDTGPAPSVVVPPVVGLRFEEAERKLAEVGLKASLGETRPSTTAPRRYVITQEPAAGTTVERNVAVSLDVSAGQVRARVPSLAGMTRDDAVAAIRAAKLELGQVVERPDSAARGTVLSSTPSPGQQVSQGTPVELVLSAGPSQLFMPDVVGRELFEVRATLEQLGLRISETQYDSTSALPAGLVISQVPAAGSAVTATDIITLRVSGRP